MATMRDDLVSATTALKRFMEREDSISQAGGRKLTMDELKALTKAEREELGQLAAIELGIGIKSS